jgi:hypothetical protein
MGSWNESWPDRKRCEFKVTDQPAQCILVDSHDGAHVTADGDNAACDPPAACSTHGRCWTHSEWHATGCDGNHALPACGAPQCWRRDPRAGVVKAPRIVVLCGSTRFFDEFQRMNMAETLEGNIVLSVALARCEDAGITAAQKIALDELHKRKIDLADEVIVINPGGYIGTSTASEIAYAEEHGKPIRYLVGPLDLCAHCHHPLGELETVKVFGPEFGASCQVIYTWHRACLEAERQAQPDRP